MTSSKTLKKTALNEVCRKYGGKMVDFYGWELPMQFEGILREHEAVRNSVGIFDVSHMGRLFAIGADSFKLIQKTNTNDFRKATIGKGLYSHLVNQSGGIVDDVICFCLALNKYLIIVNASTAEKDWAWLKKQGGKMNITVENKSGDFSMIAVQGPNAKNVIKEFNPEAENLLRFGILEAELFGEKGFISRTGYTGEDGFEVIALNRVIEKVWEKLMELGTKYSIKPCGLGARDVLRLEAGYLLYGADIDENYTTLEANYGWAVCFSKGEFNGKSILEKQKKEGFKKKLFGIVLKERGVPRSGCRVLCDGAEIGILTSATFSPSLGKGIGMGYVRETGLKSGSEVEVEIHSKKVGAQIVRMPFYKGSAFDKI